MLEDSTWPLCHNENDKRSYNTPVEYCNPIGVYDLYLGGPEPYRVIHPKIYVVTDVGYGWISFIRTENRVYYLARHQLGLLLYVWQRIVNVHIVPDYMWRAFMQEFKCGHDEIAPVNIFSEDCMRDDVMYTVAPVTMSQAIKMIT